MKRKLLISLRGNKLQSEVAKALNTSQQNISLIENGMRTPKYPLMLRFERYYNTPMAKLFPDVFNNALQTTNSSEIAS
jgi:transcriptional regulator with XRE-family HTH domain